MPAAFQAAADAATEAGDTKELAVIMRVARNLSKNWPDNAELRERAAQAADVIKVLVYMGGISIRRSSTTAAY